MLGTVIGRYIAGNNLNGRYAIKSSIKRRIELKHVLYGLRLSYAKRIGESFQESKDLPIDVGSIKNSKSDKTDKWLMGIESPVMAFRESRRKQILRYLGYVPAIMSNVLHKRRKLLHLKDLRCDCFTL
ncbi:hypothetical protein GQX74_011567 [Glossina fuscipes]|nr:hypothetical protein GQX74_011567 [Glossina fuscipes]